MTTRTRFSMALVAVAAAFAIVARADAPHVYAIRGAKIVLATGSSIATGTLVIRNGMIDAVGADVQAPADAFLIDGTGLTVYPGLIDMGNSTGVEASSPPQPPGFRNTEEAERYKRSTIFQPDREAAKLLRADAPELARLASSGITTVLATPAGQIVKGQSALVNVTGPPDEPQVGNVGDYRRGLQIVRTPVAIHIELSSAAGGRSEGYPVSLMGVIAFVRQSLLEAQHQRLAGQRYEKVKTALPRPPYDPSLNALQPALDGRLPVAFEAVEAREILRALNMAKEFKLDPVITGGREAAQVAADLKASNARVIYSLNFPTRSRTLAPDADEPLSALRERAQAPKAPAALEKAGLVFAFSSAGLREPRDFIRNVSRVVKEGLSPEAAIRALTIDAARIAGASDRTGSLEKGKIANVLVTEGDLFDERMKVRHVFVDGRLVDVDDAPAPQQRGRGRGNQ